MKAFSSRKTSEFFRGPAMALLRPVNKESEHTSRCQDLERLVFAAAELAFSLWMQRTYITCYGLANMRVFASGESNYVMPHRLHHVEENDTTLDGHAVIIVTRPLIMAWGDENAENYRQQKVWAKATICVEETLSVEY
jgi:hypothetical protein